VSTIRERGRELVLAARDFGRALPVAVRSMRRNPGFFLIAVSSLAIALGLSTTVLAHIDSLTHPYVPVRDVDRLYSVWIPGEGAVSQPTGDEIAQLVSAVPSFEGVAMGAELSGTLSVADKGGMGGGVAAQPDYFKVLGVTPRLGRLFSPAETDESGVAVVSDATWRLFFNNRSEIGDAVITFEERPYAVVGVLPEGLDQIVGANFWIPRPRHMPRYTWFIARLKPSATEAQAKSDLHVMTNRLISEYGTKRQPFVARFRSKKPDPLRLREYHGAMIGAAVCILLIACANVAALMLARGVVKRRDQALRLSLGATRVNLLTTVAAEVSVLAIAGGVAGILIANWTMHLLAGAVPIESGWIEGSGIEPHWNWRVFAESFAAMITAVAIAASLPAWYSSRIAPNEPLKESSGTTTGRAGSRFKVLVVAEIALSMVLLIGSSLIAKATRNVSQFDFGYDARPLLVGFANVSIKADSLAASVAANNAADRRPWVTATQFNTAVERVRAIKGVVSAAAVTYGIPEKNLVISDQVASRHASPLNLRRYMNVGDDFMKTLGVRIVEGRDFVAGDRPGRGAVILDQLAAKQLFPGGGAVGQLVKLGDAMSMQPWVPVVGIAHTARLTFPVEAELEPEPAVYVSLPVGSSFSSSIVIRPSGGAVGTALAVQRVLKDQFPPKTYVWTNRWLENYDEMLGAREFTSKIFVGLGLASLLLAAAGLFSVLSYSVGQRMREFAVRVALGADRKDVMRLVMRDGVVMALGGTAIGAMFGMWAGFLLNSFLWGVYPLDAQALVVAEAILFAVTMGSCIAPALRATRADPLEILRAT
jgi:putative ABC transport system permease protein